ncbi:hypothetical protein Psuf_023020 [Phytohabitans suffuscus]|uniref:Secreted protein n=1 Tax=Phytohabitans suffuscus TaxID=624315 RepID=A0A6F8YG46_9ACTN|nr:hypothetical protein Psuf_023020 [Phytohabitans suffuscus]
MHRGVGHPASKIRCSALAAAGTLLTMTARPAAATATAAAISTLLARAAILAPLFSFGWKTIEGSTVSQRTVRRGAVPLAVPLLLPAGMRRRRVGARTDFWHASCHALAECWREVNRALSPA